ncbi:MAG: PKD domain-containing protein [Saprospiraceae bacterium]|nr:PKD domain-containing protein [Saprospiraceae bacterium]
MLLNKMKDLRLILRTSLFLFIILGINACEKEEAAGPVTAQIFRSIAGKQVAFTALTLNATEWYWEFGDGETSNEMNPVHIYSVGGVYEITLTASRGQESVTATTEVSLDLSVYDMLTGGSGAANGKTWRISSAHSDKDAVALADQDMTVIESVSAGALALFLGLGEEYEDEFTFKADGSYIHDNKNGGSLGSLVFGLATQTPIVNVTEASQSFGFASLAFTPEAGATFTYTEKKDLTLTVVSQADGVTTTELTYPGVSTLSFSGNEFIGLMGFERECIIQEITPESMRLAMFMSATQGENYDKPSLVVIFTFEVVQ